MPTFAFSDCQADWDDSGVLVRNSLIERRWVLDRGLLRSASLTHLATGHQWQVGESAPSAPHPEFALKSAPSQTDVSADVAQPICVESRSLQISIRATYAAFALTTFVKMYPAMPAVSTWIEISETAPQAREEIAAAGAMSGVEARRRLAQSPATETDICDYFHVDHVHARLGAVALMDCTDRNDNLAHVRWHLLTISQRLRMQGNLFYLEDQITGDGLAFLKEAPLPHARPVPCPCDLTVEGGRIWFSGLGAGQATTRTSYPLTVMCYAGGRAGRIEAMQRYQRKVREPDSERDAIIWHNNWGDRSRDTRISASFLLEELDVLADLGMDQLHPDDGWEKGISSNSATPGGRWANQWEEPGFWDPHPERFPDGFAPVTDAARAKAVKLGIWYNVDRSDDYANWERDAQRLLDLHRQDGFDYFKLDGIAFETKVGEANIQRAMHRLVQESGGKATVLLDITAGVRQGYFSAMPYGVLFLENRYTDWHKYWPHCTLRNLWQLAEHVDPRRLVVEFLNTDRNQGLYEGDPLAPANYAPDYLFASVMFARPLAWFEASHLSASYKDALRPIVAVYKAHRQQMDEGIILPVGQEPSGFSWTGFQSQAPGATSGYLVALRELSEEPQGHFQLAFLPEGAYAFACLAGLGESFAAQVDESGTVTIGLPDMLSYGFFRYERTES